MYSCLNTSVKTILSLIVFYQAMQQIKCLFFLSGLFFFTSAKAQISYNQNILPIGDKESLMGNSGTGGLNSTGAVFYNPAALAGLRNRQFTFTGNAYMQFQFSAKPLASVDGNPVNLDAKGYSVIPTSLIYTYDVKAWKLGLCILNPVQFEYESKEEYNFTLDNGDDLNINLNQSFERSHTMAGVTAARELGNGWRVGATVFGQLYSSLNRTSLNTTNQNDTILRAMAFDQRERISTINILFVGGIQKYWDKFSTGVRISLPSIYLRGTGDYYVNRTQFLGGVVSANNIDIKDAKTNVRTPFDLRLGFTYKPSQMWMYLLDVGYTAASSYGVFEGLELGEVQEIDVFYRISGGAGYNYKDKFLVQAGLSYTPQRINDLGILRADDLLGFTFGLTRKTKESVSSIGLFYNFNQTDEALVFGAGTGQQTNEYIGVTIGTTYTLSKKDKNKKEVPTQF